MSTSHPNKLALLVPEIPVKFLYFPQKNSCKNPLFFCQSTMSTAIIHIFFPGLFFHLNRAASFCGQPNLSMDVIQPPSSQPFQNRIHDNRPICPNQENSSPFNTPHQ